MRISRARVMALIGVAALGLAACNNKSTPQAAPPTVATTPASSPSVKVTGNPGDYCTVVEQIGVQSGMMTNKHIISPLKETLDQFKALVDLSLAARDQLGAAPSQIKSDVDIQLQYFQALKDHNYANDTPLPAGFAEANARINQYQADVCGFVYDK